MTTYISSKAQNTGGWKFRQGFEHLLKKEKYNQIGITSHHETIPTNFNFVAGLTY